MKLDLCVDINTPRKHQFNSILKHHTHLLASNEYDTSFWNMMDFNLPETTAIAEQAESLYNTAYKWFSTRMARHWLDDAFVAKLREGLCRSIGGFVSFKF